MKILLTLFVFVGFNAYAMHAPIYLGNWQNKTADDIVLSFNSEQGNETVVLPSEARVSVALNKKLSAFQTINKAGHIAVIGIEKLTRNKDDAYQKISVLLALALSDEMQVFTSVVLPPVPVSEKARTFLNLVETPAPLGINFDGIIEDGQTSFVAAARAIN